MFGSCLILGSLFLHLRVCFCPYAFMWQWRGEDKFGSLGNLYPIRQKTDVLSPGKERKLWLSIQQLGISSWMILLRQESFSRQEQESHDVVPVNGTESFSTCPHAFRQKKQRRLMFKSSIRTSLFYFQNCKQEAYLKISIPIPISPKPSVISSHALLYSILF